MKKCIGIGLALAAILTGLWIFLGRDIQTAAQSQMPEDLTAALSPEQCRKQRNLARWYNLAIQQETPEKGLLGAYLDILDLGEGKLGYLQLSGPESWFPIFHETGSEPRSGTAVHQFGTALPVGVKGNCPVLYLEGTVSLAVGDTFRIYILDEALTYQVAEIGDVYPRTRQEEDLCILRLMGQAGVCYVTGLRWEGQP